MRSALSSLSALLAVAALAVLVDTEPAAAQPAEVKTVVVGLSARRGVDPGLALAMSDVVQGVYARAPARKVLGREDINRVLRFESERQTLGCDTESCLSEIAQALDVDRLITGSMDKVGSSYFIVISEIDARTVEPLGRVQGQLPLDEDQLLPGVTALARKLLQESSAASLASASAQGGTPGSIVVRAAPEGARVRIAGKEVGVTPVKVEALPPGSHEVQLLREGYDPVRVTVPVYAGGATEVRGELAAAPRPSQAQVAAYNDATLWHQVGLWSKLGTGTLCALTALPCAGGTAYYLTSNDASFWACTGLQAAIGAALCAWGGVDLFVRPEPPEGEGPPRHQLEIVPPPGQGAAQRLETVASHVQAMPH